MDATSPAAGAGAGATGPPSSPSIPVSTSAAASAAVAAQSSPSPPPSPSRSPSPRSPSSPPSAPPSVPSPPPEGAAGEMPPPPPSASSRRLAVPCWVHEETLALIDAYREKWYALRRRNLRASDWQEVAEDLARRCPVASLTGAAASSSPKTSVQCRHKVEKLRKRYRSERRKALQRNPHLDPNSSWAYFRKMEDLECDGLSSGRVALRSALGLRRPFASPLPPPSDDEDEEDDDNDEDRHYNHRRGPGGSSGHTRSLHHLMSNGSDGTPADDVGGLRFTIPRAVRSRISRADERPASVSPKASPVSLLFKGHEGTRPAVEEMRRKLEKQRRRKEGESEAVAEMVSALRALGDGFLRMEQRKMEMAREMEKTRMEMELKRTELILDSQRQIVDAFLQGFRARKRAKISRQD